MISTASPIDEYVISPTWKPVFVPGIYGEIFLGMIRHEVST
jgi:hypothetical protein